MTLLTIGQFLSEWAATAEIQKIQFQLMTKSRTKKLRIFCIEIKKLIEQQLKWKTIRKVATNIDGNMENNKKSSFGPIDRRSLGGDDDVDMDSEVDNILNGAALVPPRKEESKFNFRKLKRNFSWNF